MTAADYRSVQQRIAAAAAASGGKVRLVAVSKRQSDAAVLELAAAGQLAFGENHEQALASRREGIALPDLEWHFIGRLQSNKCRGVASHADWVQSVDRLRIVAELDRHRTRLQPPLNVLVQVAIDPAPGRSGCAPHEVEALCCAVAEASRLQLRGLMAIPSGVGEPGQTQRAFHDTRQLFERIAPGFAGFDTLSMGMSGDFEIAIGEGATMLRIGTALFGERT